MKYSNEIIINLPVAKVIEKFDNADNLKKWMTGLVSFEHVSGIPGQVGAKSKLKFRHGNREREMTETITVRNLPFEFSGIYEMPGVWNEQKNFFGEQPDGQSTKWRSETEFRFDSFVMKFLAFIGPGMFRKQSYKFMENFKAFAESK